MSSRGGELIEDETGGDWTIFYNPSLNDHDRTLIILHGLVELLCIIESLELMPGLPGGGIYAYDGGDNPKDVRYRAAKCAEKMYLRALKAGGETVAKP